MQYQIRAGDTLLSIASNKTLSPAYATALANLNGIYEDADQAFDITANLSAYGFTTLTIPDNWLLAGGGGAQPGQAQASLPQWWPIAAIAAIVLLA